MHENEISTRRSTLAIQRFAAGLTQQQLADRAGVTRAAVTNIELGKHGARPLTARALASVLGVSVEHLFPPEMVNRKDRSA